MRDRTVKPENRHSLHFPGIALFTTLLFTCSCLTTKPTPGAPAVSSPTKTAEHPTSATTPQWTEVATPYPAANITAVGNVFWVCGANEMIASSSDGGTTWTLRRATPNGKILLNIAFVDKNVGHAAGRDGVLLSTTDGGKTWNPHDAEGDVDTFSFADAKNGVALIDGDPDVVTYVPSFGGPAWADGDVKLTHDGGDHWEPIPAPSSDELKPFSRVAAVAALDSAHYMLIRRQPNVEDIFLVTDNAGKSWNVVHERDDATNHEQAQWLFVHDGEYWAFGRELIDRQRRDGGYMVSLAMHSKGGHEWTHGTKGSHELFGCNSQGCNLWDGTVVSLYGTQEQYWNGPQDFSLSTKWAIAGDRICAISNMVECGPVAMATKPQTPIRRPGGGQFDLKKIPPVNLAITGDCAACAVQPIWPDPGVNWSGQAKARFSFDRSGAILQVSVNGPPDPRVRTKIVEQIRNWTMKPNLSASSNVKLSLKELIRYWILKLIYPRTAGERSVSIDVKCVDLPDAPEIGGCRLIPAQGPA